MPSESGEVAPLLGELSVAMMEQQFSLFTGVCHIHVSTVSSMHQINASQLYTIE